MGQLFDVVRSIDFVTVLVHLALITAGAFLALYLSNLAERNRRNVKEEVILTQLKQGLDADIANLQGMAQYREKSVKEINAIRSFLFSSEPWSDQISALFFSISTTGVFIPHPGAFESYKSTGIDLIKNPDIRFGLFTVYEENFTALRVQEEGYANMLLQYWLPMMSEQILIDSAAAAAQPLDFVSLRKNPRLLNFLVMFSFTNTVILQTVRHCHVDAELLSRQIEFELERIEKGNRNDQSLVKTRITLGGYPEARVVRVAGTFNSWIIDGDTLHKTGNGWHIDMNLRPGWYMYRFIVDGNWTDDPVNTDQIENEYGSRNAWLLVK